MRAYDRSSAFDVNVNVKNVSTVYKLLAGLVLYAENQSRQDRNSANEKYKKFYRQFGSFF